MKSHECSALRHFTVNTHLHDDLSPGRCYLQKIICLHTDSICIFLVHIDMNQEDANTVGVQADDFLQVTSPRGEIVVQVRIDSKVPQGTAFMAFHWLEAPANILTSEAVDPTARIPEYKVSSIRIEKAKVHNGNIH